MNWLEWIGVFSIAMFGVIGAAMVVMLFAEWWVSRAHLRKAIFGYYANKLKSEKRDETLAG